MVSNSFRWTSPDGHESSKCTTATTLNVSVRPSGFHRSGSALRTTVRHTTPVGVGRGTRPAGAVTPVWPLSSAITQNGTLTTSSGAIGRGEQHR